MGCHSFCNAKAKSRISETGDGGGGHQPLNRFGEGAFKALIQKL